MVTVLFANPPTVRASLRRVMGINLQYLRTCLVGLIGEFGLQIIECPVPEIMRLACGFEILLVCGDVFQIFQDIQRTGSIFIDECLTETMVYIAHPTVLSPRNTLQSALR